MNFKEFKYERPNIENIESEYKEAISKISNGDELEEVIIAIDELNKVRSDFETMSSLCMVRHSIDTTDKFYDEETEFFDEVTPIFTGLENNLAKALIDCKFQNELKDKYGEHLFNLLKVQLETFDPAIIEDLQNENKLVSKYEKLIAAAKISFEGGTYNTSQMVPFLNNVDRKVRREAEKAMWSFFEEHNDEFDSIYDELVKTRDRMAKKLGYENYIDLGYKRLGRIDYNATDVANYRKQIIDEIVPLASKIVDKQAKRIGIEDIKNYDLNLEFLSGNPKPVGDSKYKVEIARKMYHEMSKETKEFIDFMIESELMDLEAKPGKMSGGYCTSFRNYKAPFVFSNFNGTSADVDVLTHEMGHAFQNYCSRNFEVLEYVWPTLESAEIHSMSMEFFAYPWMNEFFKDDTKKYLYSHLTGTITFIPYGACVDEFQHEVYKHPEMTPQMRKELWVKLEKKYTPYKIYENEYLKKGNYWLRQSHIFSNAFYYIDYTLAQVCAQQFWVKNQINHEEAWNDYLRLCKAGGSKSFTKLLEVANLKNPFNDGTLKLVTEKLEKWIDDNDRVS